MFIIRIFVKLGLIILLAASVLAQGDYLKYGESGTDFNFIYEFGNNNNDIYGGKIGISMKGIVDFGLSATSFANAPYSLGITINPLKQDKTGSPIALSFFYSIASKNLKEIFLNNVYSYGPIIFSNIRIKNNMTVQPSVLFGKQGIRQSGIVRAVKLESFFGIGLSFFFDFKTGETFKIDTAHLISKADYTFGISLGILLRQNKSTN